MAFVARLTSRGCSGIVGQGRAISLQGPLATQWMRVSTTSPSSALKAQSAEDYWAKNKRLQRPVSPHLTIYKPQITSLLSLTHRATGLGLSGIMSGFGIGMLALPNSYPYYLDLIHSMHFGGIIIFGVKFALALPFIFHLNNGIRHLVWDLGYGFTLRTLYQTGYFVVAVSTMMAAGIAMM